MGKAHSKDLRLSVNFARRKIWANQSVDLQQRSSAVWINFDLI